MSYRDVALTLLSRPFEGNGIPCYVSDFSEEQALIYKRIETITHYAKGEFVDHDNDFEWTYVVPISIKPIESLAEPDMSINQVITEDGNKQSVILQYFAYEHLPVHLQSVSKQCHELATAMDQLPSGPEKSAGLRKLLEAKDCFVRANL